MPPHTKTAKLRWSCHSLLINTPCGPSALACLRLRVDQLSQIVGQIQWARHNKTICLDQHTRVSTHAVEDQLQPTSCLAAASSNWNWSAGTPAVSAANQGI